MKLNLRKIKFENFKGLRSMEINFEKITDIFGDNATCKTTICDGFYWCLFGKDSSDRKDYNIKTLDENNTEIPYLDHSVEIEFQVDMQVITAKRLMRDIWTKKRGTTVTEFTGNEVTYFWNDVPLKMSEFKQKVSDIIDENLLKLITNPLFFNVELEWQKRREALFSISPKVENEDVFRAITTPDNKDQIDYLQKMLNQGKSLADYKKQVVLEKKKINDELLLIPARIDEATKGKPQPMEWTQIIADIVKHTQSIEKIDLDKQEVVQANAVKNKAILDKQNELNDMKAKLSRLTSENNQSTATKRQEYDISINIAKRSINSNVESISSLESTINEIKTSIAKLEADNANLRVEWLAENEKQFVMGDDCTLCPSCQQRLPEDDIHDVEEKLRTNFNNVKKNKLGSLKERGNSNNQLIETYHNKTQLLHADISTLEKGNVAYQEVITKAQALLDGLSDGPVAPTEEMIALQNAIDTFVVPESVAPVDFTDINLKRLQLQEVLDELKLYMGRKEQIEKADIRISELNELNKNYAQQLADLEGREYAIDAFNKHRIEAMTEAVNKKFKYVKFKLFESQINGGEKEICEALVNTNGAWVPFPAGNKAGQLNAGIDIINTLCEFHNVFAPIFIDNRESVVKLIATESQIINLFVVEGAKLSIGKPEYTKEFLALHPELS